MSIFVCSLCRPPLGWPILQKMIVHSTTKIVALGAWGDKEISINRLKYFSLLIYARKYVLFNATHLKFNCENAFKVLSIESLRK